MFSWLFLQFFIQIQYFYFLQQVIVYTYLLMPDNNQDCTANSLEKIF